MTSHCWERLDINRLEMEVVNYARTFISHQVLSMVMSHAYIRIGQLADGGAIY